MDHNPIVNAITIALTLAQGSNDFRTREYATQGLERLGVLAVPAAAWGGQHTDAEIATRCNHLLRKRREVYHQWLLYNLRPRCFQISCVRDNMPFIDCYHQEDWEPYGEWHSYYVDMLRELNPNVNWNPPWKPYREATRLMVADWLYSGLPLATIQNRLDYLGAVEMERYPQLHFAGPTGR